MKNMSRPLNSSVIEISKSAYAANLSFLRKKFGEKVQISSVVKGNAYGHAIETFVPMAEELGIRHFSVFSADEAQRVQSVIKKDSSVMILGSIHDADLEWAVESGIEVTIFDEGRLNAILNASEKVGKKARIHLEVETGMNRTGFNEVDLKKAVEILKEYPDSWIMEGICTHYAGAESTGNYLRIKRQIRQYRQAVKWLKAQGIVAKKHHTACSAAALTYPETVMDMVRIGIAQYGYWPSRETFMHHFLKHPGEVDPLKRVLSWRSHVMSTKEVATGEFVGYGTSYLTGIETKVAAVPIGYAHGFTRKLSNLGRVLVGGKRTSVIGVINMNMMLVDITETPEVHRGDEVVLIGMQNHQEISVSSFSELSQNLNYETLVRLPFEIPRVIVD
jgi:alanine racemase